MSGSRRSPSRHRHRRREIADDLTKDIPLIPATVVLNAKGVVTYVWFGVPSAEQEQEIAQELTGTQAASREAPKKLEFPSPLSSI